MFKNADYGFLAALALGVSFIGISLVLPLAAYPPAIRADISFRKPLIGSFLAIICLIGISAVFFPEECSKTISRSEKEKAPAGEVEGLSLYGASVNFRGIIRTAEVSQPT